MKRVNLIVITACATATLLLSATTRAGEIEPSHIASPDVYRVLAENGELRVIRATWMPGQKDVMHSHPGLAAYSLTDCTFRIYKPDGTSVEKSFKAHDGARVKGPTKKHAFENITDKPCETLLVERK
ncbi:MAG: hypothetical protein OEZ16_07680 [Chromatiales bacterium]|nr:hypothetical protein [Chromatiales bacterium]